MSNHGTAQKTEAIAGFVFVATTDLILSLSFGIQPRTGLKTETNKQKKKQRKQLLKA